MPNLPFYRRVGPGAVASLVALAPAAASAQTAAGGAVHPIGTEAVALLVSLGLLLLLPQTYANAASLTLGVPTMLGNREDFPELTGWKGRARRAEANLLTNIVPFGFVVALLVSFDLSTGLSRLGAGVFVLARLTHAVVYLLGIPGVRTLAFYAGLIGTVMTAWPLISSIL